MTLAISILALLIALGCLSVVVILIFRVNAFAEEIESLRKSTKNAIEGVSLSVEDMEKEEVTVEGLPGFSYDEKTNTVTIDGNLMVEGWVASGGIKKEE